LQRVLSWNLYMPAHLLVHPPLLSFSPALERNTLAFFLWSSLSRVKHFPFLCILNCVGLDSCFPVVKLFCSPCFCIPDLAWFNSCMMKNPCAKALILPLFFVWGNFYSVLPFALLRE
jgi:hypothetical protein